MLPSLFDILSITVIRVSHQPIIFKSSASKCLKTTRPVWSQQIHKFGHATVRLIGLLALQLLRVCQRAKKEGGKQDYTLNERYKTLPQALTFLPVVTDFHQQRLLFGGVFPSGNPVTVRQAPAHKTLSKHLWLARDSKRKNCTCIICL